MSPTFQTMPVRRLASCRASPMERMRCGPPRRWGLPMWYVPSMRNGREMREDRGSAIVSTEPLLDPRALELPLARQRRVAVGAAIEVRTRRGTERLALLSAHLEPVSSPQSLWMFSNPRPGQVSSILELLAMPPFAAASAGAGVVLGGDFNTDQGRRRRERVRPCPQVVDEPAVGGSTPHPLDGPPGLPVLSPCRRLDGANAAAGRTLRLRPLPGNRAVCGVAVTIHPVRTSTRRAHLPHDTLARWRQGSLARIDT